MVDAGFGVESVFAVEGADDLAVDEPPETVGGPVDGVCMPVADVEGGVEGDVVTVRVAVWVALPVVVCLGVLGAVGGELPVDLVSTVAHADEGVHDTGCGVVLHDSGSRAVVPVSGGAETSAELAIAVLGEGELEARLGGGGDTLVEGETGLGRVAAVGRQGNVRLAVVGKVDKGRLAPGHGATAARLERGVRVTPSETVLRPSTAEGKLGTARRGLATLVGRGTRGGGRKAKRKRQEEEQGEKGPRTSRHRHRHRGSR